MRGRGHGRIERAIEALLPAFVAAVVVLFALIAGASSASAAPTQITTPTITAPSIPTPTGSTTATTDPNKASITIDVPNLDGTTNPAEQAKKAPGQSVLIILLLTVLAIAPALLMMVTSFTRIVIVLSLTRNALGLQTIPPNQVVVGLSLFLSLFIMAPTLSKVNDQGLQPLLKGDKNFSQAWDSAQKPLKDFMLKETRTDELNMFIKASNAKPPKTREDVSLAALVPAFVLSEIKTAFIIGFVVFVPFLIIDLVVSSTLMSMGMFMLPPVLVSLPFKLLLFVMVDGWALIVKSLITSFH
ncbi:MAG TPA: flagellar type III secretion system pore protein FliP [Acidimicrobiia bacterium]|jgi:flagellar biosynthetic protein FliP